MDNPEKLDTQDTGRTQLKHQNTTQKTKKMSTIQTPLQIGGEPRCSRRISSSCFL